VTLETLRLRLDPVTESDVADIFRIYGDAGTWRHLPAGRFTRIEQAEEYVRRSQKSCDEHGLGSWAIRIGPAGAEAALPEGTFIGTGGVRHLDGGDIWNLGYRLDPSAWGRGFATEVATTALAEAERLPSHSPVTAGALVINPASIAVLEKIGLHLIWEGLSLDSRLHGADPENSQRRIYSNRRLEPASYEWLISRT
jgi:RimJ/RimL family protein N-acetyltransferase